MFNKEFLRITLMAVGSLCLGTFAIQQIRNGPGIAASSNRTATDSSVLVSPHESLPAFQTSPSPIVTQSIAPVAQPTVKRGELVLKDTVPPKALPAFVRLKKSVTFAPSPGNKSATRMLPIGTQVRVIRVNGSWIWIEKDGGSTFVPAEFTDLEERMAGVIKEGP